MIDTSTRSLELLTERVARVPAGIRRAVATPPSLPPLDVRRWTVTGVGGSEGPARVLAQRLERFGRAARFVPCSRFALPEDPAPNGGLIVFSQGLSPNARGALGERHGFDPRIIVTAVEPRPQGTDAERFLAEQITLGVMRVPHGPEREGELLVRVEGPAQAVVRALQLAAHLDEHATPELTEPAMPGPVEALLDQPVVLVGAGETSAYLHGQRWKLLEGLGVPDPPVYDVLQVAHGPLQQFYHHPISVLAVSQSREEDALFDRLSQVLRPHHRLRRLRLERPLPESWPQLELWFDDLMIATLQERPRDLIEWPGKDADAELYALDPTRQPG